jgi:hypothetical protein
MLLSIHAATGALIGQQTNNPLLSFALGLISHFVLDAIPHGDQDWIEDYKGNDQSRAKRIIFLVVLDAVILVVLLVSQFFYRSLAPTLSIASGILGGILPDFLVGCHELSDKLFKKFYQIHFRMHDLIKTRHPSTMQGVVLQAVILGIMLIYIF